MVPSFPYIVKIYALSVILKFLDNEHIHTFVQTCIYFNKVLLGDFSGCFEDDSRDDSEDDTPHTLQTTYRTSKGQVWLSLINEPS